MGKMTKCPVLRVSGRSGKFALLDPALHFSNILGDSGGADPYIPCYLRQREGGRAERLL